MGNQASSEIPVAHIPDAHVVISICGQSKIRVMNSTPEVTAMLTRLDQEITAKCGFTRGPLLEYYGTLKIRVGDTYTFSTGGGKERATLGKFFAIRLFEEMYKLGYNLSISSDLARQYDNATWFFAKSVAPSGDRSNARVCCIATGGTGGFASVGNNKLILLHHDEYIKQAVMLAIGDGWSNGVAGTEDIVSSGESLHEITLNGVWGGTHADGVNTRKTICNLVGRMGGLNWRLIASTNLKGTADSFFFMYDPTFTAHPNDFCMVALSKDDRFRLINCNHLIEPLEQAIVSAGFAVQEKLEYYGCYEIKVHGNPWCSVGAEAIAARRSIARILEMMGQQWYTPYYAIDVSRSLTDKASILFRRNPFPMNCRYACLALSDCNRIRLLDFPVDVGVPMRECIYQYYPFGVQNEVNLPDCNLEIDVHGYPWLVGGFSKGGSQYHMRAILGRMIYIAEQHGWYVSISADVSSRIGGSDNDKYPLDVHSIYFVKMTQ